MNKYRYTLSLIITTIIYILLGVSLWYFVFLEVPKEKPKEKVMMIKMSELKQIESKVIKKIKQKSISKQKPNTTPKVEPKPILKSKPKVVPKVKPKPILQPKAKIKPKPVVQPKTETKKVVKQLTKEKVSQMIVKKKEIETKDIEEDFTDIDTEFMKKVRENIANNKRYPKSAIRRKIQGVVKVIFDIQRDGSISNIRLDTDSKILEKATKKSLNKSFPMKIPAKILKRFPKKNIHLNIEFSLHS